jgi:hypothetical protein
MSATSKGAQLDARIPVSLIYFPRNKSSIRNGRGEGSRAAVGGDGVLLVMERPGVFHRVRMASVSAL